MRADAPQAVHETYELKEGPPWAEVDGGAHTTLVFIGRQILCIFNHDDFQFSFITLMHARGPNHYTVFAGRHLSSDELRAGLRACVASAARRGRG